MQHTDSTTPSVNPSSAPSILVQHYQQVLELSGRILDCATAGHWDEASAWIDRYSAAIDTLKTLGPAAQADTTTCRTLIGRILQNDARLRELIEPERNRLNLEMGNLKRQTTVLTAYSAPVLTHER